MRKVLWAVDSQIKLVVDAANYIRAQAVCIRTTNKDLKRSIGSIKSQGIDVYGWRWPTVIPIDPGEDLLHRYAMNEAAYVRTLIDEGLDGYIVDPECDNARKIDCWNNKKALAAEFCDAIKLYGRSKNPNFCLVRHREVNIQLTSTKYLGPNSFRTAMLRFLNAIGSAIMDSNMEGHRRLPTIDALVAGKR